MSRLLSVAQTEIFASKASKLLSEDELVDLVNVIASKPDSGVVIKGTGGLRKLRIGLQGRGKRGGARVIYWFHSLDYPAVLLWIYAKNEVSDLSAAQSKALAVEARGLLQDFGSDR